MERMRSSGRLETRSLKWVWVDFNAQPRLERGRPSAGAQHRPSNIEHRMREHTSLHHSITPSLQCSNAQTAVTWRVTMRKSCWFHSRTKSALSVAKYFWAEGSL